uniref:Peropsin n=1 Tax=Euphausia superba TaxID=6819 RepID=A0A142BLT2_EUPSU|nr:peropsin [Euphausia superba]
MDPLEKQWEPVSSYQHIYIGIYLFFVGILGTLDNGLVVVMFLRFRKLLTPSNMLLLNLCIADLGICLMGGFPFSGTSSFAGKWLWGEWGCQYYAFMGFFFGIGNLTTILMIALDRYLVTCRQDLKLREGVDLGDKLNYSRYIQMITFIWTWSFFWAVCPLLGWARYGYEPSVTTCTLDWQHNDSSYKSYIMMASIMVYMVPCMIMTSCYYQSAKYLRQARKQGNSTIKYDWATESNVNKMGIILIAAYLICWSWYAVVCIWVVFRDPKTVPMILTLLPPLMAKASPVLNPIIYFYANPTLKKGMIATLCCWCHDPPQELLEDTPESKRK